MDLTDRELDKFLAYAYRLNAQKGVGLHSETLKDISIKVKEAKKLIVL